MDLNTLGSKLAVLDGNGSLIKAVMVFKLHELLTSTVGFYDEAVHGSYDAYLRAGKEMLTGKIADPYSIHWYTYRETTVNMEAAVKGCVEAGCDYIVLERLPDDDPTTTVEF